MIINFFKKFQIKQAIIANILCLLNLFGDQFNTDTQNEILDEVLPFIKNKDIYLSPHCMEIVLKLIMLEPTKKPQYYQVFDICLCLAQSNAIQGTISTKLIEVFERLSTFNSIDVSNTINNLLQGITNKNSISLISKCIALLCTSCKGNEKIQDFILKLTEGVSSLEK